MKFVMTQAVCPEGMQLLDGIADVYVADNQDPNNYLDEMRDAAALIVRIAKCDANAIENSPKLKVIGRTGVGYDSVDVKKATELGIPVVITPGANNRSVAEHAVAMIFALSKNLIEAQNEMCKGNWEIRGAKKAFELEGKTVGILGLGAIGRETAKICKGCGMRIAAYDPFMTKEQVEGYGAKYYEDYVELLKDSDVVSIAQAVVMGCKRYLSLLVIVSKEFVGYLLAAIGPIALGKIYDVCHSWTMPLVLLQGGDTVVFKDLYRFTREAENGYKKYMEWLDRGINMVFLDNPTVSSDYIRQMMTTAEQQDIVTKTAMESIIKLLIIVELDRGEKQRLYISQSIKDGIAASNKKSGRKPGQLDKMSDALREDILKYLSDRSIKQVDLMRKYNISRNTLKKYVYKIQNHNII